MNGSAAPDGISVQGTDRTEDATVDVDRWCGLAAETLETEGVTHGRLDLLFVDRDEMAELNATHMSAEAPTDVLAFPLVGPDILGEPQSLERGDVSRASGIPAHLGDVVVCPEVARAQAPGHTGDPDAEMTLLVVHGVLHVLGHDHAEPEEAQRMQSHERRHLARHGFVHPVAAT